MEEVTRHEFLPGAKNKNIHVSRLVEVTRGSKISPQDCWERKQLVHMLLHSNDFQKCTFYIKWEWLGFRRSVSLYVACSRFSLLIFHSVLRPFLEICNAESLIAPVAGAYIALKFLFVALFLIYPNIILQRQSYVFDFGYCYAHTSALIMIRHRLDSF